MKLSDGGRITERVTASLGAGMCSFSYAAYFYTSHSAWSTSVSAVQVTAFHFETLYKALFWLLLTAVLAWRFSRHPDRFSWIVFLPLALPVSIAFPVIESWMRLPLFLIRRFPAVLPLLVLWAVAVNRGYRFPNGLQFLRTRQRLEAILFVVVFLVSFLSGKFVFRHLALTGDEPHYLKIAASISADFDLNLANQEPGYSPFWPGDWCRLHHLQRTKDERLISVHSPGLPILLALPYRFAGRSGAAGFLAFLAAWMSVLLLRIASGVAREIDGFWVVLAFSIGSPLIFFSFQLYPELPAAFLTVVILYCAVVETPRRFHQATAGAAIAFLPWLHTKYILLAAAGALISITHRQKKPSQLLPVIAIPVLSGAMWMWFNYLNFGTITPFVSYAEYVQSTGFIETHPAFGTGFLIADARHGLLTYGPLALFGLFGFRSVWIKSRFLMQSILLLLIAHFPVVAGHVSDRWLGWAPPCRFLVPMISLLAIPAATLVSRYRENTVFRWIFIWTGVLQVAIGWKLIRHPAFIHQRYRLFADRDAGLIHPLSLFGYFPDAADPWKVLLIGVLTLLIPAGILCGFAIAGHDRAGKSEYRGSREIHRFGAFIMVTILAAGIIHRLSESPVEKAGKSEDTRSSEILSFIGNATFHHGSGGRVLERSVPRIVGTSYTDWAVPQAGTAFIESRPDVLPGFEEEPLKFKVIDLVSRGRIVSAIVLAERALAEYDGISSYQFAMLLDLYRARRAWEQVIALCEKMDYLSCEYNRHEIRRIRCAAERSLALAYKSLLTIPDLERHQRADFEARAAGTPAACDGILMDPVPFKALPEAELWGVWPE
ncbi:hypothetical protein JXA40_03205 [bacterium]|nr:hypothetical protein [candidate division CSSED10-310 bacterium]